MLEKYYVGWGIVFMYIVFVKKPLAIRDNGKCDCVRIKLDTGWWPSFDIITLTQGHVVIEQLLYCNQ